MHDYRRLGSPVVSHSGVVCLDSIYIQLENCHWPYYSRPVTLDWPYYSRPVTLDWPYYSRPVTLDAIVYI